MELLGIILVIGIIAYVIANGNKLGTVATDNNPYSSWSDQKLWDFIVENGARKNRLMIDGTFNDAIKQEYQKLDAKYKKVEQELERRRSAPAEMTSDAVAWLNNNSELVSQVATSHGISVNEAKQLMIGMRKRLLMTLSENGQHKNKEIIQVYENGVTKHFIDEVKKKS